MLLSVLIFSVMDAILFFMLFSILLIIIFFSLSVSMIYDSLKIIYKIKEDHKLHTSRDDFRHDTHINIENKPLYERCIELAYKIKSDEIGLIESPDSIISYADDLYKKIQNSQSDNLGIK